MRSTRAGGDGTAQATGLWTSLAGHWLTPYALEPVQWLLLMWSLIRWVRLRDDRLLIAFGCVAGIAALTKLQVILLCSVLLVAVALAGPRELLRRPMLWLGGVIDDEMREYRFVAVAFVFLYVIFVATAGRPYHLVGLYAPLAAAGALGFARRREHGTVRRWPVWLGVASSTGLAVGALALSVNITRSDVGEQIADRTAETFHALPVDQQQRTAIVGKSYMVAACLDGYSERFGLSEAHSLSRSYGYFTAPRPELDSVLYIGRDAASLRDYFDTSRQIADIGEDMHAFVLTGRRQSWESMWSHERTLTVS
ncbi:MAG: hypothetical protein QOJ24_3599 [Mycobacterium sp.]|nr:hypothetical protein [Mycobacterium sp.]